MSRTLKTVAGCLLLGILLLVGSLGLHAQTNSCRGTVTDPQGEPVIAASVLIKGAALSTGVVTDFEGNFVQPNAKPGNVLVISCIGYETVEVIWNGAPLAVTLNEDSTMLDETVVTAYGGKTLRSKLTNSISTVKSETLASGMRTQAATALAGAVAGLRVSQTSGSPDAEPSIILRGGTELTGTGSPLVIVDGAYRSMADINPNDIESIEVLKDAGATAIYGARAANGVILVTTKRGQEGHTSINVHAKTSLNFFHNQYDFLDSEDYLYWMRRSYNISSWAPKGNLTSNQPMGTGNIYFASDGSVANGQVNGSALWGVFKYADNLAFLLDSSDWGKMVDPISDPENPEYLIFWNGATTADINIKTPAIAQDYSVDFQGGNDKGSYYASLGYNNTEGNAVGNNYDRFTFVLNADYKLRSWLTSNSSFSFSHTNKIPIKTGNAESDYFSRAFSLPPTMRVYNAYGDYNPSPKGNITDSPIGHVIDKIDYTQMYDKFNMNQAFTVTFAPWLNFKASGSWFYQDYNFEYFVHDYMKSYGGTNENPGSWVTTRYSRDYYSRTLNQTYQGIFNFNKTFGGYHNVSAMAGAEFVQQGNTGFYAYGQGAETDEFQDLERTEVGDSRDIDSWHTYTRILSFFGKADYDYDGKYLLSFVLRRDGYSRLMAGSRWGTFPGVSAGWVFTKEPFMAATRDLLSFGKLRLSYGANGSFPSYIGAYTVQGIYASGNTYNGSSSSYMSSLPAGSLRWEKSWTLEGGLDLGLWQNRLNVNMSAYNRHTRDHVASITVPSHTGRSGIVSNLGEFQNKGFEFEINARILNTRDWKVNFGLNGAYNINKIIKLPENDNENNRQGGQQIYVPGSYDPATGESQLIWVGGYQEGQTPGDLYSFKYGGIYRSWAEIYEKAAYLVDQSSGNSSSDNKILYGPDAWAALTDSERAAGLPIEPGDVIWEDVNGDGIIDNYDKVKIGNLVPKWTGGFNANVTWKGLTLSGRFDYALDYKVVDMKTPWILGNMQGTFNTISEVKKSFVYDAEQDTGSGKWPTYYYADQLGKRNYARSNNPLFVYEGSYLAIREITLSYALPKSLIEKVRLQAASLFVSGQNLGYLTKAGLMSSPEYSSYYSSSSGYSTTNSTYWGGYPLPRTLIFGANISF